MALDTEIVGDIVPGTDGMGRLGVAGQQFAEVNAAIVKGGTVVGGDIHLRDDERNAHWVLREETDRIVAINKITGKRYMLALTPIEEEA